MHPSNLRPTQRSEESEGSVDLEYPNNGGMYVPNKDGVTTWFTGDIYPTNACWGCWPNTTPCPHSSSSARICSRESDQVVKRNGRVRVLEYGDAPSGQGCGRGDGDRRCRRAWTRGLHDLDMLRRHSVIATDSPLCVIEAVTA